MQLLYSIDSTNDTKAFNNPVKTLENNFSKTRELLIYLLYTIIAIAKYAEKSSRNRASKNIPTFEDLHVNTKISGNQILWQIVEDKSYIEAISYFKIKHLIEEDLIRNLYFKLIETEEYKIYITDQNREKKNEIQILSFIFNTILLQSDSFISEAEDRFENWDDDAEMLQIIINNYLSKPQPLNMHNLLDNDKMSYAKLLLTTTIDKKEFLLEQITPKFKNWDADRIATLDLIILQMGLSELLYFETIPTKVTINEYIDIAKEYSTNQSGQFINGIIDNLHKELISKGKINKVEFKRVAR